MLKIEKKNTDESYTTHKIQAIHGHFITITEPCHITRCKVLNECLSTGNATTVLVDTTVLVEQKTLTVFSTKTVVACT